jgi:hypothetical protein
MGRRISVHGTTGVLVAFLLISAVDATPARAADGNYAEGFQTLFNGQDLSGWQIERGDPALWEVEDGVIVGRSRDYRTRSFLLTEREYADFVLRLEFNLDRATGGAVALRAVPNEEMPYKDGKHGYDHPMLKLIESPGREETGMCQWLRGDGSVGMFLKPDRHAELNPAGSWNTLELEVRGRSLRASVNRELVLDTTSDAGATFPDGSLPGLNRTKGRIGLQKHTGTIRFRNIQVKSLDTPVPPPLARAAEPGDSADFRPLFNGNDLSGWQVEGGDKTTWQAEDGTIVASGWDYRTRSHLVTEQEYSDFVLRLEFNLAQSQGSGRYSSSGIGIRAIPGEVMPHKDGPDYPYDHPQLKLVDRSSGREVTGSSFWLRTDDSLGMYVRPDRPAAMNPAGDWNALEVEVRGRTLRASVNGKPIVDMTSDAGATFPDGSLPGLNRTKGRIGLQKHTGKVRFRNIQVKDLTAGDGPSLYVLSIGINAYSDQRLKLDCAAPDARDIRQAFLTHSRRQFPGGVEARMLLDAQATRANILDGLKWLASKAKGNDVAVVFYAGHGDSKIEGQFYLVPFDANLRKLGASGVSGESLRKALGELPCTTMLILDACDSGGFDAKATKTRKTRGLPTATDTMLKQMVNDEGLVVMCGAAKDREAAEENGHGFFTRAIIDGLSGKADVYKKGRVDLIDLQAYVINRVGELSADEQQPTISIPSTIRSFPLSKP